MTPDSTNAVAVVISRSALDWLGWLAVWCTGLATVWYVCYRNTEWRKH